MTKKERNMGYRHLKSKMFLFGTISILLALSIYTVALPPEPATHFIVGEAYYDGSIPADGANVTVINERTSEKLYDTVGPSGNSDASGYYLVDLDDMPSDYKDGDTIIVVINGTGDYSSWTGTNSTVVDNNTASQIVNVILVYDPIPPVTTENVGEPKYGEYITSQTKINLTAIDALTAVNKTYYRFWYNGNWNPSPGTGDGINNNFYVYTGDFNLSGECLHYLEFYSMDDAGNNETIHNITHSVDNTPPSTTHSFIPDSPNGENGWYTSLSINLTSDDNKSGVHTIFYSYDAGDYQIYGGELSPPDGNHTLYYYSIDHLGNAETPAKTVTFKVDTTSPTVSIVSGPSGTVGTSTVTFEWSGSDNIGSPEYRYKLDGPATFGWSDWTSDISHTYSGLSEGGYTFSVEARDEAGNTDIKTRSFTFSTNEKPVADAGGPYTGDIGETITFDGSGSYDPDGSITSYSWTFGDGGTESGKNPSHTYTTQGTFTVTLKVTDNNGATDTDTAKVTIGGNKSPVANFTYSPVSPTDLDTITFTDTSTDDGQIINWTWYFGDGNISYAQNPSYKYDDNGTYIVVLTVKDDEGASDTVSKQIEVANEQPTAYFIHQPDKPKINEEVTFTDSSSDADGTIVNYTWNFGDGNISYEQNPVHKYAEDGTYTVTLSVTDNDGATDEATLTITVEKEQATSILPIIAIVILIIIAIAVVFVWRSRTPKQ